MLTVVDKFNGVVIRKRTSPRGKILAYQTMPEGVFDTSLSNEFTTLSEARASIGHKIVAKVKLTLPKMSNPQNQPGYRGSPKGGKHK